MDSKLYVTLLLWILLSYANFKVSEYKGRPDFVFSTITVLIVILINEII